MLTVAKVTAGVAAGYADYLEGKASGPELGDYYLKDGDRVEAPGRWAAGAEAVGGDPTRPVAGEELRALMAVRHPVSGEALRPVGGTGQAVAALDATFSAPKSVSAVWALAEPELRARIEAAHEHAIDRALHYAVAQVRMVRERVDRQHVVHGRATGLVATSWRHTTARSVDGAPPDPQLHSHVLLHAAVRPDGRLAAIDSWTWLVHRRELGAAYRTELAHALWRLGFTIERRTGRGGRYFELRGVPRELLDRWSSRHREVRAAIDARLAEKAARQVAELGDVADGGRRLEVGARGLAPKEERFLSLATRTAKRLVTRGDLDRHWRADAASLGIGERLAERLATGRATPIAAAEGNVVAEALTEFDATFQPREARAVALEQSAGAPIDEALRVLEGLREVAEVLELADGTLTTRRHRARERRTVSAAERVVAGEVEALPEWLVEREARALDARLRASGGELGLEQRAAIALGCGGRQLVVIEGQAGTGKSTVLSAVARVHQADGRSVIVTSTAGLAAERLARELAGAEVDAAPYSTAALARALRSGAVELGPDTTVIHDEAALASTRELDELLGAVEASGARLILVGDPRQSQPVGAGGTWAYVEAAAAEQEARVELTRNVRALDPADRADQARFRAGEHAEALAGYAERGRVHLRSDQQAAEDGALEAAQRDRQAGLRTLVITQTSNEHLDELNARAQALRAGQGELGQDTVPVRGRPYPLRAGDEVQLRMTIHHDDLGLLRNGTTATIVDVDPEERAAVIRLGDERVARLEAEQLDRADIRLAYVQHPFPAQGLTSDTAHLIVAEHATREGSYVALTRARQRTEIRASETLLDQDAELAPVEQLAQHLRRTEPELPSIVMPLAHVREVMDDVEYATTKTLEDKRLEVARSAEERRVPAEERTQTGDRRPAYLSAVLGSRPEESGRAEVWERAASALETYRATYGIESASALGPEPPAGEFRQRHERNRAAATVRDSLHELDRAVDAARILEARQELLGPAPAEERRRFTTWEIQ